jgi:hypothetical protein
MGSVIFQNQLKCSGKANKMMGNSQTSIIKQDLERMLLRKEDHH